MRVPRARRCAEIKATPRSQRPRGVNALSASNPKTISAASCAAEFPDQGFEAPPGKLFYEPCHTKVQDYQPRWSTTRRQPHSEGQQAHVPDCHRDCRQGRGAGEDGEINEYCQGQVYGKGLLTEVNDTRCKVRFVFLCIFEKLPRCPSTL